MRQEETTVRYFCDLCGELVTLLHVQCLYTAIDADPMFKRWDICSECRTRPISDIFKLSPDAGQ